MFPACLWVNIFPRLYSIVCRRFGQLQRLADGCFRRNSTGRCHFAVSGRFCNVNCGFSGPRRFRSSLGLSFRAPGRTSWLRDFEPPCFCAHHRPREQNSRPSFNNTRLAPGCVIAKSTRFGFWLSIFVLLRHRNSHGVLIAARRPNYFWRDCGQLHGRL